MTSDTIPQRCLVIFAVLFIECLLNDVAKAEIVRVSTDKTDVISTNDSDVTYNMINGSALTCQVQPTDKYLRDKLSTLLKGGAKIIDFTLEFPDQVGLIPGENNSTIFKPLRWVRTTGRHGRGLLLLRGPDGNTICSKLERDVWINILVISMVIIKVFVIMYSPLLVPQAWYRLKYGFAAYKYTLKEVLTLTVLKRKIPSKARRAENVVSISKFDEMPEFREKLKTMQEEVPYCLNI
ncbi:hypothetical protein KUTeg_020399 [Tegillarca granosa]|uniref:Uncharacterized protein n=1 Tax=Tegillarca granosa TaxID=220873 RepID=A0ABQ9EBZ6_TEGGR|nr:hypothetical protein KUTeg_020399 [Tegillarca granosa]